MAREVPARLAARLAGQSIATLSAKERGDIALDVSLGAVGAVAAQLELSPAEATELADVMARELTAMMG